MDKVIIKNILARGIIGIHEWEREKTPGYFNQMLICLLRYVNKIQMIISQSV